MAHEGRFNIITDIISTVWVLVLFFFILWMNKKPGLQSLLVIKFKMSFRSYKSLIQPLQDIKTIWHSKCNPFFFLQIHFLFLILYTDCRLWELFLFCLYGTMHNRNAGTVILRVYNNINNHLKKNKNLKKWFCYSIFLMRDKNEICLFLFISWRNMISLWFQTPNVPLMRIKHTKDHGICYSSLFSIENIGNRWTNTFN